MSAAGPTRRELLRFGLTGFSALSLPELVRCRSASADETPKTERTAVILVWLHGGASHIETYDPKPLAPSDYRGPFSPIRTNVPGIELCELLPHHAKVADRFTLLRSMVHTGFCHQQGTHQLLTGHPERVLRNSPLHPDLFSVAYKQRYETGRRIPNYVSVYPVSYGGPAYLGPGYNPFVIYDDPNSEKFHVPNIGVPGAEQADRLSRRVSLRQRLDLFKRHMSEMNEISALDAHEQTAVSMLTGDAATKAFDIRSEDAATRDRYGRNRWGQQLLMARRLVEAGVDIVTTQFSGELCGGVGNWDDHAVNQNVFEALKYRCQFFDQAVAALIEDIYERGLDKRVMVVVTGEFGRTPKIDYQASTGLRVASGSPGTMQPGRDHWPRATSMLFAGGGIRTGQIVGATDQHGEDPTERIVGRGDFLATMYHHLGIDYQQLTMTDLSGRPQPLLLTDGAPIPELTPST